MADLVNAIVEAARETARAGEDPAELAVATLYLLLARGTGRPVRR